MKKINSKSELGSMMIEAIAMLGLIAMVTPVLYKKSAERTSELQDINAAGEIRSIIKAVDDYVGANYNIIAGKSEEHTVTNNCAGEGNDTQDYSGFEVGGSIEIPIGHLCEFLPYGILNAEGNARASKLFSDQTKIVLKMTGSEDTEEAKGQKVITSFVVTDPYNELPILRASSISSMIGGNGGYATEDNKVAGNMGIWGVDNTQEDLGVAVKKHAIVAASTAGISAQSATVEAGENDSDNFLYRTADSDPEQRTMQNTLFMGGNGFENQNIVNIKGLAVGAENTGDHALYIKQGDIQIDEGNIQIGTGDNPPVFIGNDGTISVSNNLEAGGEVSGLTAKFGEGDNLVTAAEGILSAVSGNFGDGAVTINQDNKTTINQPLIVEHSGTCDRTDQTGCALKVVGNAYVGGNLTITGTFDADHLHANTWLSVGGDRDTPSLLSVKDNAFRFGNASTENNLITANASANTFDVTASGGATIKADENNKLEVKDTGVTMTGGAATVTATGGNVSATGNTVSLNDTALKVTKTGENNAITSNVTSFQITPTGKESHLTVNNNGTNGELIVNKMDTVFNGDGTHSNVYLRDSVFRLQNSSNNDVVRIGQTADSNAQIDISGEGVTMRTEPGSGDITKVLRVNLSSSPAEHDASYPIYIRKGAIEMAENSNNGGRPYIQTDRLISTKLVESGGLLNDSGDVYNSDVHYAVDPAYTSIMHDIKLTTRGGARLSDILPDFINKGIYVVDNTAPTVGQTCNGSTGKTLDNYFLLDRPAKLAVKPCLDASQKVSPWAGFVPLPTCPHGYAAVITVGLANAAMAQAGHLAPKTTWGGSGNTLKDLEGSPDANRAYTRDTESPEDIAPGESGAPYALYNQKNTWLKSGIEVYPNNDTPEGWDVLLGFIYPVAWYEHFLNKAGKTEDYFDTQGEISSSAETGGAMDLRVIWNMFPVYAKTIESYATVYCYFMRGSEAFNANLVDQQYNQLGNFRNLHSKSGNTTYTDRLNATDAEFKGNW